MKVLRSFSRLQHLFTNHPLTRKAPWRAWIRFGKWQVRSRFQNEVLIGWVGGQTLAVRHGMTGATGNVYVGLHEFVDMMVPLHYLKEDDLFLDVGANVGTYTVLASGVCKAKTIAFEPDPSTLCRLKRNLEINRLEERVTVYECALGAKRGNVAFTVGLDTKNRISNTGDKETRTVQMEALDEIVSASRPALMKIDVEGAELAVLLGAEGVLVDPSLKIIETENNSTEVARILSIHGFEIAYYDPFRRELSRHPLGYAPANTLYVRDWPFVADRLSSGPRIEVLGQKI